MILVNVVAVSVIVVWAFWCILYKRVSDGIVGKVLYMLLMLAALGVLSNPGQGSETALNCTVAAIGVRHCWMKTVWPHIRAAVIRRIRCATCPHNVE
ncbi:membrane protein [Pseudomonas phage Persinger]|uniref:Membrane protein n=1 Tax=Pseudomonas phage Persinger TaxID=2749430 RepID=A0A7D7IFW1_9CAUD|nr:holin [Pseudomonas phage Persinger]QMP19224.1 membrane protein [Pseudomonas phage Persinger]